MIKKLTPDQIIEAFENLPVTTKEAVLDVNVPERIKDLVEKEGLHLDTGKDLFDVVDLATVGLLSTDELRVEINAINGIPKDKVLSVIENLNSNIFNPIREREIELTEIMNEVEDKEEISPEEKNVLEKSGVEIYEKKEPEIVSSPVVETKKTEDEKPNEVSIEDDLKIKLPTGEPDKGQEKPSFLKEKLSAPTTMRTEVSDRSLPSIGKEIKPPKTGSYHGLDPYREEV